MRIDGNTTLSEIVSTDELSHSWLTKGIQKEDHKYVKREWKNGRWVYYYEDDLTNQKGSNYRTKEQREAEKAAAERQKREAAQKQKHKTKATEEFIEDVAVAITTGYEYVMSRLNQRVVDVLRGESDPVDWSEAEERAKDRLGID